jgi:predicted nucleic acid-binding protein
LVEQYQRPYLDSGVFIAWITGEVIKGVNRAEIAQHILILAQQGAFPIVTSSATLAEVHKERGSPMLTPDQDERVLAFYEHDFIRLVDVDRRIGEHANRLCRQYNLNPFDGIHVASAIRAECDVLLAWDEPMIKKGITEVRVEAPRMLGQARMDLTEE